MLCSWKNHSSTHNWGCNGNRDIWYL